MSYVKFSYGSKGWPPVASSMASAALSLVALVFYGTQAWLS